MTIDVEKDAELTVRNAQIAVSCLKKAKTCGEIDVIEVAVKALKYYISLNSSGKEEK